MPFLTTRMTIAGVAGALVLAACSGADPQPTEVVASPAATEAATEGATAEPAVEADDTEEAGSAEQSASADGERPAEREYTVDFEEQHFTGTLFRVSRIEVMELGVAVDVDIIVPTECMSACPFGFSGQHLAHDQFGGGMHLLGSDGTEYPLVKERGMGSMNTKAGERVQGTLVFQGPLQRGTTSLQLRTNMEREFDERQMYDYTMPRFELPVLQLEP